MKLGHRGANHPVKNLTNKKVEITSQNHGFEIIKESLSKNIQITHRSLFDNCIEGIKLKNLSNKWNGLKNLDLAEKVTTKKNYKWLGFKTWKKESRFLKNKTKLFKIVAIDYGIKKNILRYFSDFKCEVNIVSCKTSAEKILKMKPNGVFLSNGPGDPAATGKYAIGIIKTLIKSGMPIFGICLGHQILALALGAKTKKMKLGHRGANHPVKNLINIFSFWHIFLLL